MLKLRNIWKTDDNGLQQSRRSGYSEVSVTEVAVTHEEQATRKDAAPRLQKRKVILDIIESRRERECDSGIGASIERQILSDELSKMQ